MNKGSVSILLIILSIFGFEDNALSQEAQPRFEHYAFMDKLPKDYSYYLNGYNETVHVIKDSSIVWSEKEFPYWRFFISNIGLLVSDSIVKHYWNEAYENSPHSVCGYYSMLFERPFVPEYLSRSPIVYFYLHNEKIYFDSICNNLFLNYDESLINELRIIVTDDHGRSHREMNKDQFFRDSVNQIKVSKIIMRYGKYPGRSLVGNSLEDVAWLVIQHAPLEYQEKYLLYIEDAVKNKDLKPLYLAYSMDRINFIKGLPQIYGTQFTTENGINKLHPLKDSYAVDVLRKSVGLGELKKYLDQNNIILSN